MERLLETALRAGISHAQFWDMTPRETLQAIEAAAWRSEEQARRDVALAWHIAALTRTRRMPTLRSLLHRGETRMLTGEEKRKRREEHQSMMRALRASGLKLNVRQRNGS